MKNIIIPEKYLNEGRKIELISGVRRFKDGEFRGYINCLFYPSTYDEVFSVKTIAFELDHEQQQYTLTDLIQLEDFHDEKSARTWIIHMQNKNTAGKDLLEIFEL